LISDAVNEAALLETPLSAVEFIRRMPKVELHVHLEGSIQPATLLALAGRNNVALPAHSVEELETWYQFTDFAHFVEIYFAICDCLRAPEDFELITAEFLRGQKEQNIRHSEVIFTPYTHHEHVSFDDQLAAINRARARARAAYGVTMLLIPDISRNIRPVEHSLDIARWAIKNQRNGVAGFGLGGPEIDNPPELFAEAFQLAYDAGLASLPHAGETEGPASIRGALGALHANRLGHGVRCLEDTALVHELRARQVPLEVCPSSNVCLGVAPSLAEHPLPHLLDAGLFVTINSDDPPMFNTTLTDEYLRIHETFALNLEQIEALVLNGVRACLLPPDKRDELLAEFKAEFAALREQTGTES
jgi:adenosine deaminase